MCPTLCDPKDYSPPGSSEHGILINLSPSFTSLLLTVHIPNHGASLVVQMVQNLPAMQETQVQSLGQEDSLEKGMATHSSLLASRIPCSEEPGGL